MIALFLPNRAQPQPRVPTCLAESGSSGRSGNQGVSIRVKSTILLLHFGPRPIATGTASLPYPYVHYAVRMFSLKIGVIHFKSHTLFSF